MHTSTLSFWATTLTVGGFFLSHVLAELSEVSVSAIASLESFFSGSRPSISGTQDLVVDADNDTMVDSGAFWRIPMQGT